MTPQDTRRLLCAGTFAPAMSGSGIDLIIVSYWIPPSDGVQILTLKDVECIKQGIAKAANDDSGEFLFLYKLEVRSLRRGISYF